MKFSRRDLFKHSAVGVLAGYLEEATAKGARDRNGLPDDATEIRDWFDLDAVRDNLDGDYILVNGLNRTTAGYDDLVADPASGWEPIGNAGTPFTGTFDGNDNAITGLRIGETRFRRNSGLFARNDGTLTSVVLMDVRIDASGDVNVGSLAGENRGTVRECSAEGNISANREIGGLVGDNDDEGTIKDCAASVDVSGSIFVGGLVGVNSGQTVEGCSADGDVDGDLELGGLIGTNRGATVRNSSASGTVSGGSSAGGLTGDNLIDGTVRKCFATGTVSGNRDVGGLVGQNGGSFDSSGTVRECFAIGGVSGDHNVGGLVGQNGEFDTQLGRIQESFAAGSVSGDRNVGGLVGNLTNELTGSYWDVEVTGQSDAIGIRIGTTDVSDVAGLTSAEMKGQSAAVTMSALDFQNTWDIVVDPDDYPDFGRDSLELATVTGVVTAQREEFAAPQEDVEVEFELRADASETYTAITDENGRYRIELPTSEGLVYRVTVDDEEFRSYGADVTVDPDNVTRQNIALEPIPAVEIAEIRPVQAVFDTGLTEIGVDLVAGKQTAVLVYPSVENVEKMDADAEVTISVTGEAVISADPKENPSWDGTLLTRAVTLGKDDFEAFVSDIEGKEPQLAGTDFLGRKNVIPALPLTGTVEIPDEISGPVGVGYLEIEVSTDDDIRVESESSNSVGDVVVHETSDIRLVFARSEGVARKYSTSEYLEFVGRTEDYIGTVFPVSDRGLGTVPLDDPFQISQSSKVEVTRDADEALYNEVGGIEDVDTFFVLVVTENEGERLGMSAGFTIAGGTDTMIVQFDHWASVAHELGHQFGFHTNGEEYSIANQEHTIDGYWADQPSWVATLSPSLSSVNTYPLKKNIGARNERAKPYMLRSFNPTNDILTMWPSNTFDYDKKKVETNIGKKLPIWFDLNRKNSTSERLDYDEPFLELKQTVSNSTSTATDHSDGWIDRLPRRRKSKESTNTDPQRRVLYIKAFITSDGEFEFGDLHYYENAPPSGPPRDSGVATVFNLVGTDDDQTTTVEKQFRASPLACTHAEDGLEGLERTPVSFATPYPVDTTTMEIRGEKDAPRDNPIVARDDRDDRELFARFDPRVAVLRGELNSIPDRGFDTDDSENVSSIRSDLHDIIDEIESHYDANEPQAAARTIQTRFRPALNAALVGDYEANEPLERSRESVIAAIEDTVERSVDTDRNATDYTGEDGTVQLEGLREAITDWRAGVIGRDVMEEVVDAWRRRTEPG